MTYLCHSRRDNGGNQRPFEYDNFGGFVLVDRGICNPFPPAAGDVCNWGGTGTTYTHTFGVNARPVNNRE